MYSNSQSYWHKTFFTQNIFDKLLYSHRVRYESIITLSKLSAFTGQHTSYKYLEIPIFPANCRKKAGPWPVQLASVALPSSVPGLNISFVKLLPQPKRSPTFLNGTLRKYKRVLRVVFRIYEILGIFLIQHVYI